MVESNKTISVEMECCELFQMVNGLIFMARKYIETNAPEILITRTISRAKKFNEVLKCADYDHFTDEMFDEIMSKNK